MEEKDKKKIIIIHPGNFNQDDQNSPAKPIIMRGRSLSFSAPLHRDTFSSLPESPAAKFLAEFTYRDDFYDILEFEEGMVVNNYLIGQVLGGGVYSECREAYIINSKNANIPDKVALKIITDPRYLNTFKKEVKIWSRLNHPNILPLVESFSGDGYMVAVSILAENGNLHSFISRNGRISEKLTQKLFKQIVSAVHYLHETAKIVHLDIKLENILIRKNYDVYLCDFGTCIAFGDTEYETEDFQNDDQFCSGSVTSLPPEIFSSSSASIHINEDSFSRRKKQDMWALGITLYAMITGKLPFNDDFLPRLQHSIVFGEYNPLPSDVNSEIETLISKLLMKNPEDRPSITDLLLNSWICKDI